MLRSIGATKKQIKNNVFYEATILGLIGIPLGLLTLKYLVVALASEYEMTVTISWLTYLVSTILMLGVTLVVSVFVARKNKKIQMVESLKYVD